MPREPADVARALQERVGATTRPEDEPAKPSLPRGIVLADGISEAEAVTVALWNNGALQATFAQLGFARADLLQAGVLPNPVLSLLLPLGPKQLEGRLGWDLSWLWQRRKRVETASLRMESVAEQLVQNGLDVARDARLAHAEAARARQRERLSREAADLWQRALKLTDAQFRAGIVSELATTSVQSAAMLAAITAERRTREAELAVSELRRVLGTPEDTTFGPLQPAPLRNALPELTHLVKQALAARPDLRAAELSLEAAAAQVGLERLQVLQLTAILDANAQGSEGFEAGPGLTVPVPLFDWNQAGKARAATAQQLAAWRYLAVQNDIRADVRSAYLRFAAARKALERWPQEVLKPMERNLELAEKAVALGSETPFIVVDTTRRLVTARLEMVELETEVRRAQAELARSVGRDVHDPS